jgi:phosphatidate cytidylyltransferase
MTRFLSGVLLAAAALAAILFLPPMGMRIVVSLIAGLAAFEYLALIGIDESRGRPAFVFLAALTAWQLSAGGRLDLIPLMAIFMAALLAVFWKPTTAQQSVLGAFSLLYIGIPLGLLATINIVYGWRATVLMIATVVISDSLQYYTGRRFGRRALAPAISPRKTIEGAIGGAIAGTVFMALVGRVVFSNLSWVALALLGLVMVLLGIIGDLFESRLKREANVKDSSSLIPGHGGVLDRIDALLFVIPAFAIALGAVR